MEENSQFKGRKRSIIKKLFVPMIIVMVVQALLFFMVILWGGTIEELNNNALDILNERVINRKNYLENEMIQRWSNMDESVKSIGSNVQAIANAQGTNLQELENKEALKNTILINNADNLIYLLRKNGVSGVFIILTEKSTAMTEVGESDVKKPALYIRDSDPSTDTEDRSDLSIERAPVEVVKALDLSMSTSWDTQLTLKKDDAGTSDFYYKPLKASFDYPDLDYHDLGYWSYPFRLNENENDIITYSVPLKNKEGLVYGVLGVEITTEYLRKNLPNAELDSENKASYLLGIDSEKTAEKQFTNVVTSGTAYKRIAGEATTTLFSDKAVSGNTFLLEETERIKKGALGCVQYLKLYNSNTPFIDDQWALIGITNQTTLFSFSQVVIRMVFSAMIISLMIGIIGILIAGRRFVRPITALVRQVKKSNPRMVVKLDKTNIEEVDELAEAIESLSQNVEDAASKLSKIIKVAGIPIGAFEYNKKSNEVFYTDLFFSLLGLKNDGEKGYMDTADFRKRCETLNIHFEEVNAENDSETFEIFDEKGVCRWVKLKKVEDKNSILGVVRDVTQEMVERIKIEHERDYDILTNLLNRQAFNFVLKQKFEDPEKLKTAAIVMMDLDNLKYINDTYGHNFGDDYIRSTASVLRKFSSENAIFARISGDEFYALIYGYDDKAPIRAFVEKIQDALLNTVFPLLEDPDFKIKASGGVAWYPDDSVSYEDLLKYADFAMYEVKNTGKGHFKEFSSKNYNENASLKNKGKELDKLIDENLIHYVFQPIVEVKTGKVIGYEALMRSKIDALRSPYEILAVASEESKLHEIEVMTWFSVMKIFKRDLESFGDTKIFINSISNQFLAEEELKVFEELYAPLLNRIAIEMSEEENINEDVACCKQTAAKKWKAAITIENLGIHYEENTSLQYIAPKYVKVDMSIVQNINQGENWKNLLRNNINYFQNKNIQVIAEGIETPEELKILVEMGVDYVQGYYLSIPQEIPPRLKQNQRDELLELSGISNEQEK